MANTINGSTINLDLDTILIWCLVGLVAGFLASRVALGHGLGLFGDIVVGYSARFLVVFLPASSTSTCRSSATRSSARSSLRLPAR